MHICERAPDMIRGVRRVKKISDALFHIVANILFFSVLHRPINCFTNVSPD